MTLLYFSKIMKNLLAASAFLLVSCGHSGVQSDPEVPGQYILHYCKGECFDRMEKVCAPKDFKVVEYGSSQPEKFVCSE